MNVEAIAGDWHITDCHLLLICCEKKEHVWLSWPTVASSLSQRSPLSEQTQWHLMQDVSRLDTVECPLGLWRSISMGPLQRRQGETSQKTCTQEGESQESILSRLCMYVLRARVWHHHDWCFSSVYLIPNVRCNLQRLSDCQSKVKQKSWFAIPLFHEFICFKHFIFFFLLPDMNSRDVQVCPFPAFSIYSAHASTLAWMWTDMTITDLSYQRHNWQLLGVRMRSDTEN